MLTIAWEFSFLFGHGEEAGQRGVLALCLGALDAGGQTPLSGALLKIGLIVATGLSLVFSFRESAITQRCRVLLAGFLFWGFLAALLSPHRFVAVDTWLTWALTILLATTATRRALRSHPGWILLSLYILGAFLGLHFFLLSVPASQQRVGGVFHHPNLSSTVCLTLIPIFLARALSLERDRLFAILLVGSLMSMLVMTGSVTGAMLAVIGGVVFVTQGWPRHRRVIAVLGVAGVLLVTSLESSRLLAPISVVMLGGILSMTLIRKHWLVHRGVFLGIGLAFVCSFFLGHILRPVESEKVSGRWNSLSARAYFYRASVSMCAESPVFGVGPSGFSRNYPRYQPNLKYYSRFVHCLPLELACEWGLPALVLLVAFHLLLFQRVFSSDMTPLRWAAATSLCMFWMHSMTGVQSQFPYLFILLGVAYAGVLPRGVATVVTLREPITRLLIVFLLSPVLFLSIGTLGAAGLELMALREQAQGPIDVARTQSLYAEMLELTPLSRESWRKFAIIARGFGQQDIALEAAQMSLRFDPESATCLYTVLETGGKPYPLELLDRAQRNDPINYPAFLRFRAENYWPGSNAELAYQCLARIEVDYSQEFLDGIPSFRADDLRDQLVECWVLRALLEESMGKTEEAQLSFRNALASTQGRVDRLLIVLNYPQKISIVPGQGLAPEFQKLVEALRRNNFPVPETTGGYDSSKL